MICSVCQTALMSAVVPDADNEHKFGIEPHHQTCTSLRSSIDAGCYVCNRLWAVTDAHERRWVTSTAENELVNNGKHPTEGHKVAPSQDDSKETITDIIVYKTGRNHPAGSYLLSVCYPETMDDSFKTAEPSRRPYWDHGVLFLLKPRDDVGTISMVQRHSVWTGCDETLLLARRWITQCIDGHERCSAPRRTNAKWFPTRLIDCGALEDERPLSRLIITKNTAPHGPYMTLSHCWGLVECLSLTTQNHDSLLVGIPQQDLPQLYKDAINATRRLGIRYLWIDSLCIIQKGDDLADWHREATVMNKVYQNSFCNISADNAPDGHHSLFSSRDPSALYPQSVNLRVDGQIVPHSVVDYNFWENEFSYALINTRAWVLQERLLSPRVLHFGERQLLWECETKDAAEFYPEDMPLTLEPDSLSRFKGFASDSSVNRPDGLHVYIHWREIVMAYTACKLTFPSDKLIALSAVAKRVMEINKDQYLAGMWRRYLDRELIWTVWGRYAKHEGRIPGPVEYRAPSWSWASAEGKIDPGFPTLSADYILIRVHDFHLDYGTSDPTGVVTGGWLRLWGVLKPLLITLPASSPPPASSLPSWRMVVGGIPVGVPDGSDDEEPDQPYVMLDRPHTNFEDQNMRSELFCMPVRNMSEDGSSIHVMLLQIVDSEKGVFQRIGMANASNENVKQQLLARYEDEDKLPCEQYRDGEHLIRII